MCKEIDQEMIRKISDDRQMQMQTQYASKYGNSTVYGAQNEVNLKIGKKMERLKEKSFGVELNPQEFQEMRNHKVPEPNFKGLSKKEYNALNKNKKAEYDAQMEQYHQELNRWAEEETARHGAIRQMAAARRKIESRHQDIPPDPKVMLEKFEENKRNLPQMEMDATRYANAWKKVSDISIGHKLAPRVLRGYLGPLYRQMNRYLRAGGKTATVDDKDDNLEKTAVMTEIAEEALSKQTIGRDIVVHRGTLNQQLPQMLGLQGSHEEAIDYLQKRLKNGQETVLTEKGFCSTACLKTGFFRSEVEFYILAHKDTQGMMVAGTDLAVKQDEVELLLNAGTKFKVLKMDTSEDYKNTKIFMETIPRDQETLGEGEA